MKDITLEQLLEAGCHFGHQVTRQNPKARDFVFESRDNIHIIDLAKTKEGLDNALEYVRDLASRGGTIVVIGTKRQAQNLVEEAVKRAKKEGVTGIYYVTNRWVGGILTNFSEVSKNFKKLKSLTEKLSNPSEQEGYTKKEIGLWEKERQKLHSFYNGIYEMEKIPDAVFVIDTHLEELAVKEAQDMAVTTVGIVDTNADPTAIDYPIPANDDAVGSLKLLIGAVIDAWIEGSAKQNSEKVSDVSKEDKRGFAEQKTDKKPKEKRVRKAKEEKLIEAPRDMLLEPGSLEKTSKEEPKRGRKKKVE